MKPNVRTTQFYLWSLRAVEATSATLFQLLLDGWRSWDKDTALRIDIVPLLRTG